QAWNGELPGTLPYAAGTGESPCEVISYESDGLPDDYRGSLLVPTWADHRVERYIPRPQGASFAADRKPFIQGGKEFRPSGLAVAPDGSLFVTDWVSESYELHGKGAVWHIRWKDAKPAPRPTDPKKALLSPHRPTREAAARALVKEAAGRKWLREQLASGNVRARAAALTALIDGGDKELDLARFARADAEVGIREMAVRALVARGAETLAFAADKNAPSVRAEAVAGLRGEAAFSPLLELLTDSDPYLRQAAIRRLGQLPEMLRAADYKTRTEPKQRIGILLAWRSSGIKDATRVLADFLADPDPDVRLLAAKWVSDEKLTAFRPQIAEALKSPSLDPRAFVGLATTLARLDDKPVNEDALASYFLARLIDKSAANSARLMALRAIPASFKPLRTEQLTELLRHDDPAFRIEGLRALTDRGDAKAAPVIREIAGDNRQPVAVRAQALVTLAALGPADVSYLSELAASQGPLRQDALRGLNQAKLSAAERTRLEGLSKGLTDSKNLIDRVLGKPFYANRPAPTDTDAWLKRLEGPADLEAGRRIFEHPRLANCSKCHRVDGRGADVGPDLSLAGRTERRWIVESILQPAAVVAPHYQPWRIDTLDGRTRTGLLVGTYLDVSEYVDAKGDRFKVEAKDVVEATPTPGSIMPDGLVDLLTDQEVRDLVAYLMSRK
ncbi:MAG TPA: HEAT repeat domain-containing protein, partial [Gemmataceae bacterium]|nr:HEAT repeat domain-containing protein [Gemmataceae bacterium]